MSWRVHITWRMLLLVVWTGATGSNLIRLEWEMECGCTGMEVEAMALLMPLLTDPSFLVATNWCDEMCPGYPPTDLALIKGASKRKLKQVDMKVYHVAFRGVCATFHGEAGPRARVVVARAMSEVSGLDQEAVDRCNLPSTTQVWVPSQFLSLIHISEPTRLLSISYAVFCLKKKKKNHRIQEILCNLLIC
eukprot:TRINITY_DN6920_c0_g1_i2.p2 TRINITY_DN6920_c0_g1~~TRINITY_DN6920_c0_g1_i2.p2  ORF type:complete len:191 (+),score=51.96 TRINITY_DN6920_c0_g1_i2:239-811(+)